MKPQHKQGAKLRADAASVLFQILEQGQSSRICLAEKQKSYTDGRDKAWLQEIVFGCLRQLPTLQTWLRQLLEKPLKGNKKVIEHLILVGFYQLAFTRVSEHAAVSETVAATQRLNAQSLKGLVNGILRQFQRQELAQQRPQSGAAAAGMSNWIYQAIHEHYPDHANSIINNINTKAPLWLRVNQQKTSIADFQQYLSDANVEFQSVESHPHALIVENVGDVTLLPGFAEGWFAVQDGAAQLAADYLAPEDNERILDCCAAPGGKTSHILEQAPNAHCIALDNDPVRLLRVKENLARLGHTADIVCADAGDVKGWWDGKPFDRILLDAPCSATGVIRRHPDIRWLRKKADIAPLVSLQSHILSALWQCLKSGGTLVYATCSILPEENVEQIKQFLTTHPDATLRSIVPSETNERPGRQILPGEQQMDGFYYARLLKS